jgi:hypothetical protein
MARRQPVGREVQRHMGAGEKSLHMLMCFCTLGLWYPIYRTRRGKLERTTDIF